MTASLKKRLLVFIVAYNAEKTIDSVLTRIPTSLQNQYDVEVLVIDDASQDRTFERGEQMRRNNALPFPLHVLFNPRNQGYGGNQKIGFHYAIEKGFDFVALVHGDGQYAPECLPELVVPLAKEEADAVFGSRMLTRNGALKGGMPMYKFIGNKILTFVQNRMLGTNLSEFHSGYRLYAVDALKKIPFDRNTNVFHFDTEIIIQLVLAGQRIKELPIPTYYGDEICHVDGLKYAWDVLIATMKARMQSLGLFYDRKFDCQYTQANGQYQLKLGYLSPHTLVLDKVKPGSRVLDLGCAGGYLAAELQKQSCDVTGLDVVPLAEGIQLPRFVLHDLNQPLPISAADFDYILLMDVIEHLAAPERFLENLLTAIGDNPNLQIIVSTPNIGFLPVRLMLLFGQFNYGKRGILDMTHTRLFTVRSLKQIFEQNGFDIIEQIGVPAPFCLAVGNNSLGRLMTRINQLFIKLRKTLFSYQVLFVVRPRPTLETLLKHARESSAERAEQLAASA